MHRWMFTMLGEQVQNEALENGRIGPKRCLSKRRPSIWTRRGLGQIAEAVDRNCKTPPFPTTKRLLCRRLRLAAA